MSLIGQVNGSKVVYLSADPNVDPFNSFKMEAVII